MPVYQAPQIDASASFDTNRANEAERRGWSQDSYNRKNEEPVNFYDFTRKKLNFEIKRGEPLRDDEGNVKRDDKGRTLYSKPSIIPLGTQPISLKKRYDKRLQEIGHKPWENANGNQPNTNVSIVLNGDHDRMTEIAFGKPTDFQAGEDNSQVQLVTIGKDELEAVAEKYGVLDLVDTDQSYSQISIFALCYYKFLCEKFGEENVIGLACHLDETTPHFHALVIPVAEKQKSGRAGGYTLVDDEQNPILDENGNETHITTRAYERMPEDKRKNYVKTKATTVGLSYASYFGKSISAVSRSYEKWHDMIHKGVTKQWGFDRGEILRNMTPGERNNHRRKTKKQLERERLASEKRTKEQEEKEKEVKERLKEKEQQEKALDKRMKDKQDKINQLSTEHARLQRENAGLQVAATTGKAAQAIGQSIAGVFGQSSKDKEIASLKDTIAHEPERTAVAVDDARNDERQKVITEIKKAADLRIGNDGKETAESIGKAWRRNFDAKKDLTEKFEAKKQELENEKIARERERQENRNEWIAHKRHMRELKELAESIFSGDAKSFVNIIIQHWKAELKDFARDAMNDIKRILFGAESTLEGRKAYVKDAFVWANVFAEMELDDKWKPDSSKLEPLKTDAVRIADGSWEAYHDNKKEKDAAVKAVASLANTPNRRFWKESDIRAVTTYLATVPDGEHNAAINELKELADAEYNIEHTSWLNDVIKRLKDNSIGGQGIRVGG